MSESEYPTVEVAAVLVLDQPKKRMLWMWNARWRLFALPVCKVRPWQGLRVPHSPAAARVAAERAAAEALGTLVVVNEVTFGAQPVVDWSRRDGRRKRYAMTVYRADPHPDHAKHARLPDRHVWLTADEVLKGELTPLSGPCRELVRQMVEAGWLPG